MLEKRFGRMSVRAASLASLLVLVSGCGSTDDESIDSQRAPLVAICAESEQSVPDGSWVCGEPLVLECDARPGTAAPDSIYVVASDSCDDRTLLVDEGPFALGEHEVVVSEGSVSASAELCRSHLVVVDTTPPRANPSQTTLWPPNHQLHTLSARTCAGAVDACDPDVAVRFTSATSDEPADAQGDGAFEPDIVFDGPDSVSLRAERQGPENGRVYSLSWLARDASGNELEGTCTVTVPHDRSGKATVAGVPVYTVIAPRP
jgi:hypothetical protein